MTERAPVTYRDAGVDIDAGDELVERIKPRVKRSLRSEVLGGIGGFGALVEVPLDRYRKPVLVSGTDGVGTKLRLAIDTRRHDGVGIDLVAMCANDVVVQGAEPLYFLDYFACGKLDVDVGEQVIAGIVEGNDLLADIHVEFAAGKIVQKVQRLGALHDHVVGTHRHQIDAHAVVAARINRQAQFGADPV